MAVQNDIEIWKGESAVIPFVFQTTDGGAPSPIDLTGSTVTMFIQYGTTKLTLDNGTNGGVTLTDAANGEAEIALTYTQTAALPESGSRYELWRYSGTTREMWLYGFINVTQWVYNA